VRDVPDVWWFVLLGVVVVLLAGGVGVTLRRRDRASEHVITAEPEDRPLAAVVINPVKIDPMAREDIAAVCDGLGWAPPLWLPTTPEDPGTGQAREAIAKGADVVIACGGDGTVRAVAQSLAGTRVAMGLVPAGTGNLLARTLRIPTDVTSATRVALTGDDRAIDVGRLSADPADPADDLSGDPADPGEPTEERVFLVMAGTGLDATIMESTPEELKGRVGTWAYIISGLRAMRGRRARVSITIDDGPPLRRSTRMVVVGNTGTLVGGLALMPDATVDDGRLDVVSLAPKGLLGWVAVAVRVVSRNRRGSRRIEHWQAHEVVITSDVAQPAQVDGDLIGEARELQIRVDAGALVVRVPGRVERGAG
jgi:diacylglycerol kinase (ATP)